MCEDFWHLGAGAARARRRAGPDQRVVVAGRDLAATNEVGLGTATSWQTLIRTYAQLTTSFVVFCNRVGVDESISFWGGSEVIAPTGEALFTAPLFEEGLFTVDVSLADVRRERVALPLLRDERPEWAVRELSRIVAERAGLAWDSTADADAQPGLDVAPGDPVARPIGFRPGDRQSGRRRARPTPAPAPDRRRRPTEPMTAQLFELPTELASTPASPAG